MNLSKDSFQRVQLNKQEKELVTDLYEANCKVIQIARVLHSKFDKTLSTWKIRNMIQKLVPDCPQDDAAKLQNFLEKIEEEGGTVRTENDANGNVAVLYISSSAMKKAFLNSACTTVQVDTSFNFDASKYKVNAFCYLNPTTNRAELCAVAFLSDETAATFKSTFNFFKEMCTQRPSIFIVDKDFTEIGVLKIVFPDAAILLCTFHVIKIREESHCYDARDD